MDAADLESLLVNLGVDLDNDAVEEARTKMDADESGTIELNEFMRWYQAEVGLPDKDKKSGKSKYSAVDSSDDEEEDDDDSDDDDKGKRNQRKKTKKKKKKKKTKEAAESDSDDGADY